MFIKTNAIVINTLKYGDSSLIVTCYCEELGLKSFFAKGVLKSRKGSLRRSFFQPLNILSVVTNINQNGPQKLLFFKEIKIVYPFQEIHLDINKNNIALFLSEVLKKILPEDGGINIKLYQFIKNSILFLERKTFSPVFHLKFLIELTRFLGFYPNLENMDYEFFDLENGRFSKIKNSINTINGKSLIEFKKIIVADFNQISLISISNNSLARILSNLLDYFRLHLQNFNNLKSHQIVNALFQKS